MKGMVLMIFKIFWGFEGRYQTDIEVNSIEEVNDYIESHPRIKTIHGFRTLKREYVTAVKRIFIFSDVAIIK